MSRPLTALQTLAALRLAYAIQHLRPFPEAAWFAGVLHLDPHLVISWSYGAVELLLEREPLSTWRRLPEMTTELAARLGSCPPMVREKLAPLLQLPTTMALEEAIRALQAWNDHLRHVEEATAADLLLQVEAALRPSSKAQ